VHYYNALINNSLPLNKHTSCEKLSKQVRINDILSAMIYYKNHAAGLSITPFNIITYALLIIFLLSKSDHINRRLSF